MQVEEQLNLISPKLIRQPGFTSVSQRHALPSHHPTPPLQLTRENGGPGVTGIVSHLAEVEAYGKSKFPPFGVF